LSSFDGWIELLTLFGWNQVSPIIAEKNIFGFEEADDRRILFQKPVLIPATKRNSYACFNTSPIGIDIGRIEGVLLTTHNVY
jgi:hypothetical protein